MTLPNNRTRRRLLAGLIGYALLSVACTFATGPAAIAPIQGWRQDRGPVVPHDSFPDDCQICHVGNGWSTIKDDFFFDHKAETGVALNGAHADAQCLRCHNDRGPVSLFAERGCVGCHEDWHQQTLGNQCDDCHEETVWQPKGMIARHALTRFPLTGAHAGAACWRCHEAAEVGIFKRASTECVTCHAAALARAVNPPNHQVFGFVTNCQRCHNPVQWQGAVIR
jgi:hypothetical protein